MQLYERFEVADNFDGADGKPARTWDTVLSAQAVIYRGRLNTAERQEKLARAGSIFSAHLPRTAAPDSFELFTAVGSLWLVAPSEAEAAPIVEEMRNAALLPALAPLPPPAAAKCQRCGAANPGPNGLCAQCTAIASVRPPVNSHINPPIKPLVKPPLKPAGSRPFRGLAWGLGFLTVIAAIGLFTYYVNRSSQQNIVQEPSVAFTASPDELSPGEGTELRWRTENASTVSLDHGIGTVASSGTLRRRVSSSTTFTLTAHGPGGDASRQVTISVKPRASHAIASIFPPSTPDATTPGSPTPGTGNAGPAPGTQLAPSIALFMADRTSVRAHETVQLRWLTHNATSLSLYPSVADPNTVNAAAVRIDQTTTFTLTARGNGPAESRSITIQVLAAPQVAAVPTARITANNIHGTITVREGESVRLCWNTTGASEIQINQSKEGPASSCVDFIPPNSGKYTLTATGAGGQAADEVTVNIAKAAPPPAAPQYTPPPHNAPDNSQNNPPAGPLAASGELVWSGNVDSFPNRTVEYTLQWNASSEQWQPALSNGASMSGAAIPYQVFSMFCRSDEGERSRRQTIGKPGGGGAIHIRFTFKTGGNHQLRLHWQKPD